jgi:hypothetical protein
MTFAARRAARTLCLAFLLAGVPAPCARPPPRQTGRQPPAGLIRGPAAAPAQPAAGLFPAARQAGQGHRPQPHPQHHGHCRRLWGLAVLWLLLATRAAAGLEAWAERICARRWMQGLLFFAAFLVITPWPACPSTGSRPPRQPQLRHQRAGLGQLAGRPGQGLGLSVLFGAPVLLLFNWIVRRWPRRYWLGAWLSRCRCSCSRHLRSPLLEPIFNKFEPLA